MVGKKGKKPSETPRCTRCRKRRPLHKWFGVTPGSYGRDHEACARCSHCHRNSQCSVCELWSVEDWGKVNAVRTSSLYKHMHPKKLTPLGVSAESWYCVVTGSLFGYRVH